jgi:Holliday junction resolvase-like predicted endonuclease
MHMTPWKAERIRRAARAWLVQHRLLDAPWQIDLIAIDVPASGLPRVRHYRKVMSD